MTDVLTCGHARAAARTARDGKMASLAVAGIVVAAVFVPNDAVSAAAGAP